MVKKILGRFDFSKNMDMINLFLIVESVFKDLRKQSAEKSPHLIERKWIGGLSWGTSRNDV